MDGYFVPDLACGPQMVQALADGMPDHPENFAEKFATVWVPTCFQSMWSRYR
jgi:pentose-5-phosphate-3-epimerase